MKPARFACLVVQNMAGNEQGSREFHGNFPIIGEQKVENSELVFKFIEKNQLGSFLSFNGPFGERKGDVFLLVFVAGLATRRAS